MAIVLDVKSEDVDSSAFARKPTRGRISLRSNSGKSTWLFLQTLALCLGLSQPVQSCRLALMLGLDVSSSVDRVEYDLQRVGLALALTDPEIMDAIISPRGNQVELMVFEWSGRSYQKLVIDWTTIDGPETLYDIAAILRNDFRASIKSLTAIGNAMLFAETKFDERLNCAAYTLDLSGDGKSNDGPRPEVVKVQLEARGIIINGLVIGTDEIDTLKTTAVNIAELSAYFQRNVISGPGAFVEKALGFDSYADAIKRKLLRETVRSLVWNRHSSDRQPS